MDVLSTLFWSRIQNTAPYGLLWRKLTIPAKPSTPVHTDIVGGYCYAPHIQSDVESPALKDKTGPFQLCLLLYYKIGHFSTVLKSSLIYLGHQDLSNTVPLLIVYELIDWTQGPVDTRAPPSLIWRYLDWKHCNSLSYHAYSTLPSLS